MQKTNHLEQKFSMSTLGWSCNASAKLCVILGNSTFIGYTHMDCRACASLLYMCRLVRCLPSSCVRGFLIKMPHSLHIDYARPPSPKLTPNHIVVHSTRHPWFGRRCQKPSKYYSDYTCAWVLVCVNAQRFTQLARMSAHHVYV